MNKRENNIERLMLMLIDENEPITIREISDSLNVSQKTVRNYLDDAEDNFNKFGVRLIRKPNVGNFIDLDSSERPSIRKLINNDESNKIYEYSSIYRQKYILETLFRNRYTYTIQLFADDLYCSKNTIVNDLIYVEEWLGNYNIILKRKQNQGLWIEGSEKSIRSAMMSLFLKSSEKNKDSEENYKEINNIDYRIDYVNYKRLKKFFPKLDVVKVQTIIQNSENKLGCSFTDQAFVDLVAHIAIVLQRIKLKKTIEFDNENFDFLKDKNEYHVAEEIRNDLIREFNVNIPEEESTYICLHILGAKIQEDIYNEDLDELISSENDIYVSTAKEIIKLISEILQKDLTKDELLLASLTIHLRQTLIRLKYGLELRNPMLKRIKKEYTNIFGATWACNSIFEGKFNISINEDEIGYITLHIAVAIERLNRKIKTTVVCSSGIGTSQLIANRLRRQIEDIQIIRVVPLSKLDEKVINKSDLIISTVPIDKSSDKIIKISNFVDENDIKKVRKFISKIRNHDDDLSDDKLIESILDKRFCFIDTGEKQYLDIIKYYALKLEKSRFVRKGFCDNVLKRELKSSTVIGNGISIPHSTSDFVLSPKICIIKLEKPVLWNDENIDFIIILALKFKDIDITKKFFKYLYSVFDNTELIEMLRQLHSGDEIINLIIDEYKKS